VANSNKQSVVSELERRLGRLKKLDSSQSLYSVGNDAARIYFRYSKVHPGSRTFFGLRSIDLQRLEGHNSFICFLTDGHSIPIFVPYASFEEVFREAPLAGDGQYKVQLVSDAESRELYIPRMGRFNVDGYVGFDIVADSVAAHQLRPTLNLSHCQVQSLLAGIGHQKGFDVFVPSNDACRIDWTITPRFPLRSGIPNGFERIAAILSEVDVLWIGAGRHSIHGLFEVEHSTPVYSGLLRFNDVLLSSPDVGRFFIVANDTRRELFARQINRPTFRQSGLTDATSFLEYANVYDWHSRQLKERPK
jgi:hypothetical protein